MDFSNLLGGLAVNAVTTPINYNLAEMHANNAFNRQKELMNEQYKMNQSLQKTAMANQVEGARLAGLNPAMLNGQMSNAQSVGQNQAPKAENVEINPQDLLLKAQAENLAAETEKTRAETEKISGVDTENTKADTNLKKQLELMHGANTDKINEEINQLKNINTEFNAENDMIKDLGQVIADKWRNTDWYNKLAPDTKKTIDAIANGDIDLSIGGMKALRNSISAQSELSDSDRKLVDNAFKNTITEAQFKNPEVMKALEQMPAWAQTKLKTEIIKLMNESDVAMWNAKTLKEHLTAWEHENLGWLRANDQWGTYAASITENLIHDVTKALTVLMGARVAGGTAGSTAKAAYKSTEQLNKDWMDNMQKGLNNLGTGGRRMDMAPSHGVQSMKFKK